MRDPASDQTELDRLKSVHNERTKLSATYMNGIAIAAIAAIAVGGLAPIAQSHFETMSDLEIRLFLVKLLLVPPCRLRPTSWGQLPAQEDPMTWLQLAAVAAFPVGTLIVGFGAFWFAQRAV